MGFREGSKRLLAAVGAIGELFTAEMVLKGHAEKQGLKVCVQHMSGCSPLSHCSHGAKELDERKVTVHHSLRNWLLVGGL